MVAKINWALAGGKPQANKIIETSILHLTPPCFITPSADLPQEDLMALENLAKKYNIPIIPFFEFSHNLSKIKELDFLLTCRFSILPKEIYSAPRLGTINIHNSLLPKYRGTHPISWAIINDETETGITFHLIDEKIDNGPIIYQEKIAILDNMNLWDVTELLEELSCRIFIALMDHVRINNQLPSLKKQIGITSFAPRRYPQDSRINFNSTARQIFKLIKALPAPLPPAFCFLNKKPITFYDAEIAGTFITEKCMAGTVQAKIFPNIYLIKAQNAFIKIYSDQDLPLGIILE